jgi:hypothetical protein
MEIFMTFTKTLLAVAMFATVGSAQANNINAGNLLLSVIDTTNRSSYSIDLGVTAVAFEANPVLNTTISDANYAAFVGGIAAGDNVTYNIQSNYAWKTGYADLLATYTTSALSDVAALYTSNSTGVNSLSAAANKVGSIITLENGYATSSSVLITNGALGYVGVYGVNNTNTEGSLTNQIAVGSSLYIYESRRTAPTTVVSTQLATVNFDLGGHLVIGNSAPAAVPLPTSVWMFLSGIVGLVSMKRRKNAAI